VGEVEELSRGQAMTPAEEAHFITFWQAGVRHEEKA
jgi:hypothetical protein